MPLRKQATAPRPPSKAGGDIRSLINLGETASTSRVLNLNQIYINSSKDEDYAASPFFRDPRLNKCIVIKHTLRANELGMFGANRRTATKVVLPFDATDLRLGGRSIFVGQTGFGAFCRDFFVQEEGGKTNSDVEILQLLDTIPSLDPFLVRELLSRNGHTPASCYLKISPHDVERMTGFATVEIERLVKMAFGSSANGAAVRLAGKILSNQLDNDLQPLQTTLKLSDTEFSEGIFSWRGFLYFKWRYTELQDEMRRVTEGLAVYTPLGQAGTGINDYIQEARVRLIKCIAMTIIAVGKTLAVYDKAYGSLVDRGDLAPFRKFLLDGPKLFYELGESIAVLGHIGSFWNYRMAQKNFKHRLHPDDFADILMDFEDSLSNLDGDSESV